MSSQLYDVTLNVLTYQVTVFFATLAGSSEHSKRNSRAINVSTSR